MYDLRNIVKGAPGLTLAVNLLAVPAIVGWMWLAVSLGFSYPLTMFVFVAFLAIAAFFACLMVATFEDAHWLVIFVQLLVLYYWCSALWKLIKVVRRKASITLTTP